MEGVVKYIKKIHIKWKNSIEVKNKCFYFTSMIIFLKFKDRRASTGLEASRFNVLQLAEVLSSLISWSEKSATYRTN